VRPQVQADRRGADEERGVQRRQPDLEARDDAHVRLHGFLVHVHRFAHVGVLVGEMGEELHRLDVGVAVDHPRHDERAPLGAFACQLAQLRHEVAQEHDIAREPQQRRHPEAPVGDGQEGESGYAVDRDVPDRADARHRALAQRVRGLHHAVGDAPGEVVLEERPALPHHVPVALPADEARRPGYQRVVPDRDVGEDGERAHEQHERHHAREQRPLLRERLLPVGRFHERDQPADEQRDHRVEERHREAGGEHGPVPALGLPHEVPVEGDERLRRLALSGTGRPADSVEEFQDFLSCPAALVRCNDPAALIVDTRRYQIASTRSGGIRCRM
jgi:hypothetical protein